MDVRKRVKVHTFLEIDRIEYLDLVRFIYDLSFFIAERFSVLAQLRRTPCQHLSTFDQNGAFRIRYNIGRVHQHQVWLNKEACFT